jgi:hypothetical protein
MVVGAAVLVALAVAAFAAARSLRDSEQLVADGPPAFNLVYAPSALSEQEPRRGELARIAGRRRNVSISIAVRRVAVPPYERGDVVGGYLPLLAEQRIAELDGEYGGVEIFDEGKARINLLPGYQIGFGARVGGERLFGRDTYVFPDDPRATEGVLLSMRRVVRGRQRPADEELFDLAKDAFASFAFGSDRP